MSCVAAAWRGRAGSWMPVVAVRRGTVAEPRTPPERGDQAPRDRSPTARGRDTAHLRELLVDDADGAGLGADEVQAGDEVDGGEETRLQQRVDHHDQPGVLPQALLDDRLH